MNVELMLSIRRTRRLQTSAWKPPRQTTSKGSKR
ncbi:hypothetical protein PBI_MISSWHITE_84 [Mycobacterium phage MissWhite]|nr:hypothetical protein PBI_MISSWHITE_84 [Mycobacterium phage MissWhite]